MNFTRLDDSDILASAKYWVNDSDPVLSDLSARLINRNLLSAELQNEPFPGERLNVLKERAAELMRISREMTDYYVYTGSISNLTYAPDSPVVRILLKNGAIADIASVSDMFDHRVLSERVTKYFLCYPKEIR